MIITINNEVIQLDGIEITLSELMRKRHINEGGIAIAVNNRIVKRTERDSFILKEGDSVTVISAAFGG